MGKPVVDWVRIGAVFIAGLSVMLLNMYPAEAIELSPAQLKMAKQLSAGEKAKLAASVGLQVPAQGSAGVATGDQNVPLVQPVPVKPEGISALEAQFNSRLAGGGVSSHAQGVASRGDLGGDNKLAGGDELHRLRSDVSQRRLGGNPKDRALRETLEHSVPARIRAVNQHLSQFGYELFAGQPTSFTPVTDIPVPPEYALGPGDELKVQYYGSRSDSLRLIVDREGVIELPEVGSLTVVGMSFVQAKAMLSQKIRESLIGVTASISMGRLRSIRVFVLGDARNPGSYLVSGVSTMSNALFLAGGVSKKGSLRHLQLKRHGTVIRDLDLYEFLLRGNSKNDERLLPGDVVFIPPVGRVIAVSGEVVRPAIYEVKNERTVADLIRLAGGTTPTADLTHIQVDRIESGGDRTRLDVSLKNNSKGIRVHNGDVVSVYQIPGLNHHMVSLLGQVKRPGDYGFRKGMKLGDLIRSRDDLLHDAFLDYVLIQRTHNRDRSLTVLRASLKRLLDDHDRSANIALQDEDKVFVLSKSAIEPLDSVHVSGEVVSSGDFPLTAGMRVVDLLLSAGGVTERAYLKVAEITRYQVINGEKREADHIQIDLAAALAGNADANVLLQPFDVLTVRRLSNWRSVESVELSGEVRFPGVYPVEDGEHLSSLLERAGGFTDKAYLEAAVFTRASIRDAQQQKLSEMSRQVETEIARLQSASANLSDPKLMAQRQASIASAKKMLEEMKQAKATGRLVIRIRDVQAMKGKVFDIALHDGDSLYIPKRPDEILVMGQVYNNNAMLYQRQLSVDDYISRAGGFTRLADEDHVYVVHASGIVEPVQGGWHRTRLQPGDAIVVPENPEQFNLLGSALDWSKVLYQFGTALASMKVIGIL